MPRTTPRTVQVNSPVAHDGLFKSVATATDIPRPTQLMSEMMAASYVGLSVHSLAAVRQGRMKGPQHLTVGKAIIYERRTLDEYLRSKQKKTA